MLPSLLLLLLVMLFIKIIKKLSQNKEWAREENPAQHKSLETGKRSQSTAVGKRKKKDVALIVTDE